jgi:predicted  nucleic acid-binding Zn-ribbon protein
MFFLHTCPECNKQWNGADAPDLLMVCAECRLKEFKYLTKDEIRMLSRDEVNLQIVIALQTCKTKADACELIDEIRRHERLLLETATVKKTSALPQSQDRVIR